MSSIRESWLLSCLWFTHHSLSRHIYHKLQLSLSNMILFWIYHHDAVLNNTSGLSRSTEKPETPKTIKQQWLRQLSILHIMSRISSDLYTQYCLTVWELEIKKTRPDSQVTKLRETRPKDNKTESKEESFICPLPHEQEYLPVSRALNKFLHFTGSWKSTA